MAPSPPPAHQHPCQPCGLLSRHHRCPGLLLTGSHLHCPPDLSPYPRPHLFPLQAPSCFSVVVLVAQLCVTLCDPVDRSPPGSSVHGILQARILEYALLQGIFPTQGSNLGPLHCRQILYCLSHQGSPPTALVQLKKNPLSLLLLLLRLVVLWLLLVWGWLDSVKGSHWEAATALQPAVAEAESVWRPPCSCTCWLGLVISHSTCLWAFRVVWASSRHGGWAPRTNGSRKS